MDINDILKTDEIKVSKHSWTVRRDGKTVGVIRGITGFPVLNTENTRKAFEVYPKIKKYSNREARITSGSFYEKDGEVYYLYSMSEENFYANQLKNTNGIPLSPDDYERFLVRKNAVEKLGQNDDITVISAIQI